MPRYKVIVQVYKTYEFDAVDIATAKQVAADKVKLELREGDRFNVNEPHDKDAAKAKQKAKSKRNKT